MELSFEAFEDFAVPPENFNFAHIGIFNEEDNKGEPAASKIRRKS